MRRIFLHCVDSRIEETGAWYSRLHLGPFPSGLATTRATALRRSRLSDLPYVEIQAVELEGAAHEYSRLSGIHEPVLDLLLAFREVAISGPSRTGKGTRRASFEVRGPGVLRAADLRLPAGRKCIQPEQILAHLAPGAILRGRALLGSSQDRPSEASLSPTSLKVPGRLGPVRRVGFRIEDAGPLEQGGEIVVFEILTDGTLAPQQALRQASERLVRLFLGIVGVTFVEQPGTTRFSKTLSRLRTAPKLGGSKGGTAGLGELALRGYRARAEPLGLDLGNLDLSFSSYQQLRQQGISTLGQLVNALLQQTLSPPLREEAALSVRRFGLTL